MYQKIIKLEESNNNLSHLLNDEISQRQILEKHSTTSIDAFSGQLNILKNNYDKIEEILVENISKLKEKNNQKIKFLIIRNFFIYSSIWVSIFSILYPLFFINFIIISRLFISSVLISKLKIDPAVNSFFILLYFE